MNKINAIYVSLLALIISVACAAVCMTKCNKAAPVAETAAPAAPVAAAASTDVETIKSVLNSNPEIVFEAMQRYQIQQEEERQKAAAEKIKQNIKEITEYEGAAVVGNPNGSITLVEFFDFSCGFCHRLYPALKNIIAKNPDVKVMVKSLAFVSPTSQYAAKAALAAGEQGKYAEMYSALFEMEGEMTEASIDAAAAGLGLDMEKYKADLNSAKVEAAMSGFSDLAGKIQVNGVPALVLNGEMLQTIDENVIQDKINEIKAAQ